MPSAAATYYVSPTGNDASSGTLAAPFATVGHARDVLRTVQPRPGGGVEVLLRGGRYELPETLVFGPEDSGTDASPVTYAAAPGEHPILSGGRRVTDWQPAENGLWQVTLPEVRDGKWYPRQLFVNGVRRPRARIPNEGFLRSSGPPRFGAEDRAAVLQQAQPFRVSTDPTQVLGKFGLRYRGTDLQRWHNLDDVTLHVMHAWTSAVHWLANLDEARHTVRFTGFSRFPASHFERQMPYFVENVREGLDAPGEWYLDRQTGVLSYLPLPGEDMRTADVVVSTLKQLVRFDGDAELGLYVEHLRFRGLSFQNADWGPIDRTAETDGFSSVHFLDAAIDGHALRHCTFADCEITRCGGYGLYLLDGSAHNQVQRCELHDVGGGGILIGSRWSPADAARHELPPDDAPLDQLAHHNTVDNCFIHGTGRVFCGVVGIFVAHAPYNTITHNELCELPYTAIVVGRRLDYKYSHAHHNTVAYNHIHHLGNGVMSDMGGIYTEGLSPGTRLHHNVIHDVNRYRYGGWGLYCDQASSFIQLDHNLVYRCQDGGFMQNVGQDNVLRHNIFAYSGSGAQLNHGKRRGNEPVDSMTIEQNIIQTSTGQVLARYWSTDDAFRFDRNLYWKPPDAELKLLDWSWDAWRQMGQDGHSVVAGPLFVDAEHDDFRLRPGSPAEQLGFEPIDVSEVGLYGDPAWVAKPKQLVFAPFVALGPPPPDPVQDDFEDTPVGEPPDSATVTGETARSTVRVSDETAAPGGRQSLKFTDAAGLAKPHWPWMAYLTKRSETTLRLSFDLRLEPGATFWHEWRTSGSPYRVGPSVRIEDGVVTVAGRRLATVPLSQWLHLELTAPVAKVNSGRFELTITGPAGPAQRFGDLPCGSGPAFDELSWLGFISLAETETAFYLDNVDLREADAGP